MQLVSLFHLTRSIFVHSRHSIWTVGVSQPRSQHCPVYPDGGQTHCDKDIDFMACECRAS